MKLLTYFALKYTFKPKNVVSFWGTSFPIPPTGFVPRPPTWASPLDRPHGDFSPQAPSFVESKKSLNYTLLISQAYLKNDTQNSVCIYPVVQKKLHKVLYGITFEPHAVGWRCLHQNARQSLLSTNQCKIYVTVINILC